MNFQEETEHIVKNLPQMPDILSGVFDAIKNNSVDEVARIISTDSEFEKYFLSVINSNYFSIGGDIKSAKKAVVMLGLMRVKNIVLILFDGSGVHFSKLRTVNHQINNCFSLTLLIGQTNRVQAGFFYPSTANRVLNALLFSHLLFRWGHKVHPSKEDDGDEDKTN